MKTLHLANQTLLGCVVKEFTPQQTCDSCLFPDAVLLKPSALKIYIYKICVEPHIAATIKTASLTEPYFQSRLSSRSEYQLDLIKIGTRFNKSLLKIV